MQYTYAVNFGTLSIYNSFFCRDVLSILTSYSTTCSPLQSILLGPSATCRKEIGLILAPFSKLFFRTRRREQLLTSDVFCWKKHFFSGLFISLSISFVFYVYTTLFSPYWSGDLCLYLVGSGSGCLVRKTDTNYFSSVGIESGFFSL